MSFLGFLYFLKNRVEPRDLKEPKVVKTNNPVCDRLIYNRLKY